MALLDPFRHLEALAILIPIFLISLRFRFIDMGGVAASFAVGYLVYVFGGREYFAVLLTFYLVSVSFTKLRVRTVKEAHNKENGVRSWKNVLANGCTATLAAVMAGISSDERTFFAIYLGAISSAFADTLATEIGLLYPGKPRLITSMREVRPGTPGGVTPLGYLGGVVGMIILALVVHLLDKRMVAGELVAIIFSSGLVGMTVDSILGASIQAKYRCRGCGKDVESPYHCGQPAEHLTGLKPVDTHVVNLLATVGGALTALATLKLMEI